MDYSTIAGKAAEWAKTKIGCPYSQAKRLEDGVFDCSSLIARAYIAQGKKWLYGGGVPTSCQEVYDDDFELLWPVSYKDIGKEMGGYDAIAQGRQPGDIQYLCTDINTSRQNRITHVTMVVDKANIVHARGKAFGVVMSSINTYNGKVCAITRYNPQCTLRQGMKGHRTKALQTELNAHGIQIDIDGEYGSNTAEAVKLFQQKNGIDMTGQADYSTLNTLGQIYEGSIANVSKANVENCDNMDKAQKAVVTGNTVFVRIGPGVEYEIKGIVKKGDTLDKLDINGWQPILIDKEIAWISSKYIKTIE